MYLELCNPDQLKTIYEELNVTEESLKRDVNYLMEWCEKQPHLPNAKDETFLTHLLLRCKNSLERAKKKLDAYYTMKCFLPNVYTQRDPCDNAFRELFHTASYVALPKLTPEGDRIWVFRLFDVDKANQLTVDEYLKLNYVHFDISVKGDNCRKVIQIYDMENVSTKYLTTVLNSIRKLTTVSKEFYTHRIGKIIVLNVNPIINSFSSVMTSLLKSKLMERVEIWTKKSNDLTEILPRYILPSNYGGEEKSLEELKELYYEYIGEFRDWLISEEDMKADISKRTDNLYTDISMHGIDGSFRQLSVD